MISEWNYRQYRSKDNNDIRNDKYEIDKKFKEAFSILKSLGAKVPDEFYKNSGERYKKGGSLKE